MLRGRRSRFYEGDTLQKHCDDFMEMVSGGAKVYEFPSAIIVLEDYGLDGNVRAWLLFDKFCRATIRAMDEVTKSFSGSAIYASTHDQRINGILQKIGYVQYAKDENDFFLVYRN
jgi:hypothetical protein